VQSLNYEAPRYEMFPISCCFLAVDVGYMMNLNTYSAGQCCWQRLGNKRATARAGGGAWEVPPVSAWARLRAGFHHCKQHCGLHEE